MFVFLIKIKHLNIISKKLTKFDVLANEVLLEGSQVDDLWADGEVGTQRSAQLLVRLSKLAVFDLELKKAP